MNKREMQKRSLDEQERHLALRMSSLERLTPEGMEREHMHKNNREASLSN
jgi:hypothetical protein